MLRRCLTPYDLVQLLSSAAKSHSLSVGVRSHSFLLKLGFLSNPFVATSLLNLYSQCSQLSAAQQLFDEMPHRSVVTWNALIRAHSQSPDPILAIGNFSMMLSAGISPSPSSVSIALVAASRVAELHVGTMLHCVGSKLGLCCGLVLGTALVDMYSKCYDTDAARRVFDEMEERNVVTWTSLVTGYAVDRRPDDAMALFREMRRRGVGANLVTYNSLLTSFTRFQDLDCGNQVHCLVVREGMDSDCYVSVTLLTMYSNCGSLEYFVKICGSGPCRELIFCNAVIAGYLRLGEGRLALGKFLDMSRECVGADFFTFASVLRAIGVLSALEEGRQTHGLILKHGHASNVVLQNGLVSMYAKCGVIHDSKKVFSSMDDPDLVSWNSLLSGCAQHGYGGEAVELFEKMRRVGVRPDQATFLSVISACSHVGLVDKGLEYFYLMRRADSLAVAGVEHYACVVDLLGRAGLLEEAESFVNSMPVRPGISVYKALLSACRVHGNVEIAKRTAEHLAWIYPDDSSSHVLLANVFAADGCWENAAGERRAMWQKGTRKKPAWSLIEEYMPNEMIATA
ncbi:pentatricopeptide repeat-containing protein-like, chloroplastic [Iris pallida]|uniref:Pentatricopeptide repeat-containing protein-like, chloroplastic n=1 Tax=Iris pallida TaxID=29817 RepID=A0AAX6GIJ6_IRIPA|nr:pentatricopeptide repeat-containing protein-like, chloroplastic [Iris pallida]